VAGRVEMRREDRVVRVSFHPLVYVSLSVHAVSPPIPSTVTRPVVVRGGGGRWRQHDVAPSTSVPLAPYARMKPLSSALVNPEGPAKACRVGIVCRCVIAISLPFCHVTHDVRRPVVCETSCHARMRDCNAEPLESPSGTLPRLLSCKLIFLRDIYGVLSLWTQASGTLCVDHTNMTRTSDCYVLPKARTGRDESPETSYMTSRPQAPVATATA